MVLSAVVVPWTRASSRAQKSWALMPCPCASCSTPVMTPTDWSSGVVGVLSRTTRPSGVTQIRSVNVPPTSMPTLKPALTGSRRESCRLRRRPVLSDRRRASLVAPRSPPAFSAHALGLLGVDLQRAVLERAGQHHAVLALGALGGDV